MFPKTQLKPLMKKLVIKEEKNAVFFLKRLESWLQKNGTSSISIAKGINKILDDIHQLEIQKAQELKRLDLAKVKNPILRKYAKEILELHESGMGVRNIQKTLLEAHRAKISYSTIYRFIKEQKGQ